MKSLTSPGSFYRIPRQLITGNEFKRLSTDAKLLGELDTGKGFGLIERVKQGQGRPAKIYVKRFTTRVIPPQPPAPQEVPRLRKI